MQNESAPNFLNNRPEFCSPSGLVAGDFCDLRPPGGPNSAIAAFGLRFGEFRSPHIWGRVGLAILRSLRSESAAATKDSIPARESLAISVEVGVAGDVATQIDSDLQPRVEGH